MIAFVAERLACKVGLHEWIDGPAEWCMLSDMTLVKLAGGESMCLRCGLPKTRRPV